MKIGSFLFGCGLLGAVCLTAGVARPIEVIARDYLKNLHARR